jgi:putative oxidoreductase
MSDAAAVDLCLLVLRATVGVVMLAHGINHIVGGGKITGTAGWFESLGMRPGILHAWLASVTEVVAGVLLVGGLATSLAAGAALAVMLVAWITNHRGNGFFIFRPGEGWEYVMTLSLVCVAIGGLGAGEWSLDGALDLDVFWGSSGLALAVLPGVLGAAGLLAIFWRPTSDD